LGIDYTLGVLSIQLPLLPGDLIALIALDPIFLSIVDALEDMTRLSHESEQHLSLIS